MGSHFRNFPQSHSWRGDVRRGHLTMDCQLHSYLHVSITEPGRWACGNVLDLCRHLLGWLSGNSLAASGNKGPDARGDRAGFGELSGIPAKRYTNTRYPTASFCRVFWRAPAPFSKTFNLIGGQTSFLPQVITLPYILTQSMTGYSDRSVSEGCGRAPRITNYQRNLPEARQDGAEGTTHQSATSADAFLRRMVALLMMGRAQKPTLRTNPNVT